MDPITTIPGSSFVSGQHDVVSSGNSRPPSGGYIAIPTGGTFLLPPTGAFGDPRRASETQRFGALDDLTFDYTAIAPGDPSLPNNQLRQLFAIRASEFVFAPVPEPSGTLLLGFGGLALLARRKRS
ncbi:MAG: hypothetical protein ACJAVK_000410 [Akkermansiaceae bacterium]|jgi:hypothetical protein